MKTIAERVLAGVMWLDMVAPMWRGRIRLGDLDMRQPTRCIIGQVFQNYWNTQRHFGFTDAQMAAMGFQAETPEGRDVYGVYVPSPEYGELADAWRAVLSS